MRRRLPLLLVILSLLAGCGYHPPGRGGNLPAEVRTLHIELFANRTAEPFVENGITDLVTDEFARSRYLRLSEDKERADAVLSGAVSAYSTVPISYDRNDEITEYRSALTITATLRRAADGKVLWKGDLSWDEEYPSSDDKAVQEDNEAEAILLISDRLAEELYFRIVDNF
jgi:outer membrane lipopolysaccharide assembly protein LptE/RlpB